MSACLFVTNASGAIEMLVLVFLLCVGVCLSSSSPHAGTRDGWTGVNHPETTPSGNYQPLGSKYSNQLAPAIDHRFQAKFRNRSNSRQSQSVLATFLITDPHAPFSTPRPPLTVHWANSACWLTVVRRKCLEATRNG